MGMVMGCDSGVGSWLGVMVLLVLLLLVLMLVLVLVEEEAPGLWWVTLRPGPPPGRPRILHSCTYRESICIHL